MALSMRLAHELVPVESDGGGVLIGADDRAQAPESHVRARRVRGESDDVLDRIANSDAGFGAEQHARRTDVSRFAALADPDAAASN